LNSLNRSNRLNDEKIKNHRTCEKTCNVRKEGYSLAASCARTQRSALQAGTQPVLEVAYSRIPPLQIIIRITVWIFSQFLYA